MLYGEDIEYISNYNIDWGQIDNSTILITGASGLIGTVLIDALMYKNITENLNIKLIALVRDKEKAINRFSEYVNNDLFKIIQGDITKDIVIEEKRIDYIINLAANTHPALYASEPIKTIETIIDGLKKILNLAVEHDVKRVINTSSVEIYGENRGDVEKFREDYCGYIDCNTIRAGYSESKRVAESISQAYIAEKKLDIVSIRLGRVYGPTFQESDSKATSQFIRSAVARQDIILKSEGKQEYSYVYVADAVTAFLLLLTRGKNGEAYNVANDEVKSFYDTATILAKLSDKVVKFEIPSPTEFKGYSVVQRALMDSGKIDELGWKSKYQLEDGMTRTVHILRSIGDEKA
jgi:Nucleoside-diphosphate-sugar epimerases